MNKKILIAVFAIIGLTAILLYTFVPKEDDREPIIITAYSSYESMSLDTLITDADLIVAGTADVTYPSRWNTSDGKLPRGTTVYSIAPDKFIFTDINFNVNQVLKGEKNQNMLRIRSLGGVVEQDQMIADDVILKFGKNYLLFLLQDVRQSGNTDPIPYWTFGHQGIYEIADGKAISIDEEWVLEELIAYIEKKLSSETLSPTLTITPVDLFTETPIQLPVFTKMPLPTMTPTELLTEPPTELPGQIPTPSETASPTP